MTVLHVVYFERPWNSATIQHCFFRTWRR